MNTAELARNFPTVESLRLHYVQKGGFTGGWNVAIEWFRVYWPLGVGRPVAVSAPMERGSWILRAYPEVFREVEVSRDAVVLSVDWETLVNRVVKDALRNSLIVMKSGGGIARRSRVPGLHLQSQYAPEDGEIATVSPLPLP